MLSEKMSELNETFPSMCCVSTSVPIIFRIKSAVEMESGQLSVGHLNIIIITKTHSKLTTTVHLWWFSGS